MVGLPLRFENPPQMESPSPSAYHVLHLVMGKLKFRIHRIQIWAISNSILVIISDFYIRNYLRPCLHALKER